MFSAIVLAAGTSSRFGSPKQLALLKGKPVLQHVLDHLHASRIDDVVVVLGAHADEIRQSISLRERVIVNPAHAEGMSTSIHAGIRALDPRTRAALFVLADQPFVQPPTIDAILGAFAKDAVVPRYRGQRGNPVLVGAHLFPDLLQLRGDSGFRSILPRYEVTEIDVDDPGIVRDIDTPDDLTAVLD